MISRVCARAFSSYKKANVPIIDLKPALNQPGGDSKLAHHFFDTLQEYRCVFVRDPRYNPQDNLDFRNQFTEYFSNRLEGLRSKNKFQEVYKKRGYVNGLVPFGTEGSPDFHDIRQELSAQNRPRSEGSVLEDVVRYKYPLGDLDQLKKPPQGGSRFAPDIEEIMFPEKSIPEDFPHLRHCLEHFGSTLVNTTVTCATLCEQALNWEKGFLTNKMNVGVHTVSPGVMDLDKLKKGSVICSFHKDYVLLTAHGAPNFGGFLTWTDNNEKYEVEFPEDCILIQTGYTLEYFSGGLLKAGFHEVEYTDLVEKQVEKARSKGESLLRINSTMFADISPYDIMKPHNSVRNEEVNKRYPDLHVSDYLLSYLKDLGLVEKSVQK